MKNRIDITIAVVSGLLSCVWGFLGCQLPLGYVTIDWGSSVVQPTFCMYRDPYFQEPLSVGSIDSSEQNYDVSLVRRSDGEDGKRVKRFGN